MFCTFQLYNIGSAWAWLHATESNGSTREDNEWVCSPVSNLQTPFKSPVTLRRALDSTRAFNHMLLNSDKPALGRLADRRDAIWDVSFHCILLDTGKHYKSHKFDVFIGKFWLWHIKGLFYIFFAFRYITASGIRGQCILIKSIWLDKNLSSAGCHHQ